MPSQFDNPDNIKAHYKTTGPEIWEQTGGKLDAYVGTQGTGGQLTGIGRYLRKKKKKIKLYAGEPAECPLLSRREWGEHKIEGIGDGFVPRDLDLSLLMASSQSSRTKQSRWRGGWQKKKASSAASRRAPTWSRRSSSRKSIRR